MPNFICGVRNKLAAIAIACLAASPALGQSPAGTEQAFDEMMRQFKETGFQGTPDYGVGTGLLARALHPAAFGRPAIPTGPSVANITGVFGPAVTWPLIGLHAILLPDGRVLNYGTDGVGRQGAQFIYDIWNPALGTGANAHMVLPNTTPTDIFCTANSLLWQSGDVLIAGGDLTIAGKRNYSRPDANLFLPASNTLQTLAPMQYARWYPSMLAMPNGEMLVLGGKLRLGVPATVPEIYNPQTGWRSLTGADSAGTAGIYVNWFYPRAALRPDGSVLTLDFLGQMHVLTTTGAGSRTSLKSTLPASAATLPTVMYAPGRLLSIRNNRVAVTIDITKPVPVSKPTQPVSQDRFWATATVLADGKVLLNGGSKAPNQMIGVAYQAEIWDPVTGAWTLGASAAKPRLYHNNALLLPDATVLTLGGGAPGPVANLNAEIYYPPYLFQTNGSGMPAPRPVIVSAPDDVQVGGSIALTMSGADTVTAFNLVRTGSATHSTNTDQQFVPLPFTQTGRQLAAQLPANANVLRPGYYMVFVLNAANVPSLAPIMRITPAAAAAN